MKPQQSAQFPFSVAFGFGCDLLQTESEIAKTNWRTAGKRPLDRIFYLAIIGGGINGWRIARHVAGRGDFFFLFGMNDFAEGGSCLLLKHLPGGLRYPV